MNFPSFFFYQSTVDGHQMYFGGLVVGKASTIGRDFSPIPTLIFTAIKKCEIWCCLKHLSTLSCLHLKMQQDIPVLKQKCNAAMITLCPGQVWWSWVHPPLRKLCQLWPTPKNCTRKRAKSSTAQPGIIRFRSNFVQTLITWHLMYYKLSW